ncbi:MAG: AI-2E family transporter, partial [Pseudomonadota bacterium]
MPTPVPDGSDTQPGHRRVLDSLQSDRARAVMLAVLTVAAAGAILLTAKPVLAPILFGLVVGIVVSPIADTLYRLGVPRVIVAAALLAISSGLLVLAFLAIEPLISSVAGRLPEIRSEIREWMATASDLLRGIENLSDEIERTVGAEAMASDEAPQLPTVMDAILLAPNFGASVLIFVGTLFFFVLTRADLYASAGPLRDALMRADDSVARYFGAVTVVNLGLGVCTALALSLVGLDNAVLWGLAAGVLNYVLYLGPLTIMFGLLVAGMVQFG